MKTIPLYAQPQNPIYSTVAPSIGEATQKTCGAHGGNLQYTDMDSINNCRMTKGAKAVHRIPAVVKPCSGKVDAAKAGYNHHATYSKKEFRSMAARVLRERGIPVNAKTIAGILSGKTL